MKLSHPAPPFPKTCVSKFFSLLNTSLHTLVLQTSLAFLPFCSFLSLAVSQLGSPIYSFSGVGTSHGGGLELGPNFYLSINDNSAGAVILTYPLTWYLSGALRMERSAQRAKRVNMMAKRLDARHVNRAEQIQMRGLVSCLLDTMGIWIQTTLQYVNNLHTLTLIQQD